MGELHGTGGSEAGRKASLVMSLVKNRAAFQGRGQKLGRRGNTGFLDGAGSGKNGENPCFLMIFKNDQIYYYREHK